MAVPVAVAVAAVAAVAAGVPAVAGVPAEAEAAAVLGTDPGSVPVARAQVREPAGPDWG